MPPSIHPVTCVLATGKSRAPIAAQSNEPITLDDSDEEEATAEADQAQPGPRRTTRSTAYKGPADVFKVMPNMGSSALSLPSYEIFSCCLSMAVQDEHARPARSTLAAAAEGAHVTGVGLIKLEFQQCVSCGVRLWRA